MNSQSVGKETRYLIRLENPGAYTPVDCDRLLHAVRERVQPLKGHAMNLRVSRSAIEFDVFCKPDQDVKPLLSELGTIGPALTVKKLNGPPSSSSEQAVVSEARALFNEERYWEVHEVLEDLWKKTHGSEKELLQGLILVAAALVHVQKNQWPVVWPMLQDAQRRLQNKPDAYYGLNLQRFLNSLEKTIATKTIDFPTI